MRASASPAPAAASSESFTVRKISYGEGVERVFPVYSPNIDSIKVVRRGVVRRAKLYYLRDRRGKSARIAERAERPGGQEDPGGRRVRPARTRVRSKARLEAALFVPSARSRVFAEFNCAGELSAMRCCRLACAPRHLFVRRRRR